MTTDLEERIGAALRSAAGNINPTPRSSPTQTVAPMRRRRWIVPMAAAVTVLAVVATSILLTSGRTTQRDMDRAATLTYSAGTADIGGVAFPVPSGWAVSVVEVGARQVRACVAEHPSSTCDGVSIDVALPDGPPLDIRLLGNCRKDVADYLIHADNGSTLGGRDGAHYYQWCGKSGPVSHQWLLMDFGLQILTPAGKYERQGQQIANGLDLSQWPRSPGEPQIHSTMATRADGNTAADAVIANGRVSVYGASFPVPDGWDSLDISESDEVRTICLAPTPTTSCGGVTIRLAAPDAPQLAATMPVDDCAVSPKVPLLDEKFNAMGRRPAQHIIGTCGGETGPAEHLWELTDRSLQIITPRGQYAAQGTAIASGVDLGHWQRPAGTETAGTSTAASLPTR